MLNILIKAMPNLIEILILNVENLLLNNVKINNLNIHLKLYLRKCLKAVI